MKVKLMLSVVAVLGLTACSKPYDFTGSYELTKGDGCAVEAGDNTLIVISSAKDIKGAFVGRLDDKMAAKDLFPLQSAPASVAEDGTLTLTFSKEGESGWFSVVSKSD